MSDLARQRIRENIEAHERGEDASCLDLSQCSLSEVPEEVEKCGWVEKLRLWGNKGLSDLSPLANLTTLQSLDCHSTQVSSLAPLANLTSLQWLDCHSTQVSDLVPLANLTALQWLNCSSTRVSDLSALVNLAALRSVNCSSTKVSDLSPLFPAIEKGVPVLRMAYVGNVIEIQNCPLIHPPPEIARQGNAAILNYFRERDQQGTDTLCEAKLLVVGEGGSGKTSLIRRLYQTDQPLPPKEDTTKGVDIHRHDFPMPSGKDFRLHVWDFGGQEIYHATHQFFLTKHSLYVLLDNSRSDHKTVHDEGFRCWLEVIDNLSEHSPVLIFQNRVLSGQWQRTARGRTLRHFGNRAAGARQKTEGPAHAHCRRPGCTQQRLRLAARKGEKENSLYLPSL